jgi:hypothetical protein
LPGTIRKKPKPLGYLHQAVFFVDSTTPRAERGPVLGIRPICRDLSFRSASVAFDGSDKCRTLKISMKIGFALLSRNRFKVFKYLSSRLPLGCEIFRQIANHASSTAVEVKDYVQELLHQRRAIGDWARLRN